MPRFAVNVSLKAKLIGVFCLLVFIFLATAAMNLYRVDRMNVQLDVQNSKVNLKVTAMELKGAVQDLKDLSSALIITRKPEYADQYAAAKAPFNDKIRLVADTASTDEQIQWRSQLITASATYLEIFDRAIAILKDSSYKEDDIRQNMQSLNSQAQEQRDVMFGLIDKFYADYAKDADRAVASTRSLMEQTVVLLIVAAAVVLLISSVVSTLMVRSFTEPIRSIRKVVAQIAEGDLRHKIQSAAKDELGELSRSFDSMVDRVRDMLANSRIIASSLSVTADEFHRFSRITAAANADIVRAIEDISEGAGRQASRSEQSAQVIAGLQSEIMDIWQYTEQVKQSSEESVRITERGAASVQGLDRTAKETADMMERVSRSTISLADAAAQINGIVGTITEISTQTHLLSLNAAIEAASAGAHGKGFSVISNEVRKLSQETNRASKSAAELVRALQVQVRELEGSMARAKKGLDAQSSSVAETLDAFGSIRRSTDEITVQIERIHGKITQVHSSNSELVGSVQAVAAIAEETAAGVQEVNSTSVMQNESLDRIARQAEEIRGLSARLFSQMLRFRVDEDGDGESVISGERNADADGAAADSKGMDDKDGLAS